MVRLSRLVALFGGLAASTATLEDWQQRFQTVGFEINPLKVLNGDSLLASVLHRSNWTIDGANYISLRGFFGNRPAGGVQLITDLEPEVPSVEEFLEAKMQQVQQMLRGGAFSSGAKTMQGVAEADVDPSGEAGLTDSSSRDGRRLNVYADDHRQLFNWEAFPDRAFGKLMFPASYYCTGQLIGKRYVLTAAHCFYSNGKAIDGNNIYQSVFRAAYHTSDGKHYYASESGWGRLWYGTTSPETYRNQDWAIIELDKPLGEVQGYLGINPTDLRKQVPIRDKFMLIGYSSDMYAETAGKDPRCTLEDFYQGVYLHNCDCQAGASGGAILDPGYNIVGTNTAHIRPKNIMALKGADYNPTYPNLAVPAFQFMPTYAQILQENS